MSEGQPGMESVRGHSGSPNRLSDLLQGISGLSETEALIRSKLESDAPLLHEVPSYLLGLGGKRIRPLLSLLCGEALGLTPPSIELIDVSAGIELIHMATLLHDDIIDKSPLRRSKESPYVKFGMTNTLLSGDFLLVRAFSLCARLDPFIIDSTEAACIALTEGEILETSLLADQHDRESSLRVAEKKTASLFWLAARSAAHLSGASQTSIEAFSSFGRALGIAFQVMDDVLDVFSPEHVLGKKVGIDIRERKPSLVNVLWLESGSSLAARLRSAPRDDEENFVRSAIDELRSSPVLDQARAIARSYLAEAEKALALGLGEHARVNHHAVSLLRCIIEYTEKRLS